MAGVGISGFLAYFFLRFGRQGFHVLMQYANDLCSRRLFIHQSNIYKQFGLCLAA